MKSVGVETDPGETDPGETGPGETDPGPAQSVCLHPWDAAAGF